MSFPRHDLLPLTAALFAALAVLFVSTASMACEVPVDRDMASMSTTAGGAPCEQETETIRCEKACLVFCQGLVPQAVGPTPAYTHASVRYPSVDVRHADFTREAEDPPPRS